MRMSAASVSCFGAGIAGRRKATSFWARSPSTPSGPWIAINSCDSTHPCVSRSALRCCAAGSSPFCYLFNGVLGCRLRLLDQERVLERLCCSRRDRADDRRILVGCHSEEIPPGAPWQRHERGAPKWRLQASVPGRALAPCGVSGIGRSQIPTELAPVALATTYCPLASGNRRG
jgi:hypothetical protein